MSVPDLLNDRDWLEHLLEEAGAEITDAGYDFTDNSADLVYEINGRRIAVTIRGETCQEPIPPNPDVDAVIETLRRRLAGNSEEAR